MSAELDTASGQQAELASAVRRAIVRNDLLMLASAADDAVGIVLGDKEARKQNLASESDLFSEAFQLHMAAVDRTTDPAVRLNMLSGAGVISRFCKMVDVPLPAHADLGGYHDQVLLGLDDTRTAHSGVAIDRDLFDGRVLRGYAIRDIRLSGDRERALKIVSETEAAAFEGTGADQFFAEFQIELGFALVLEGQFDTARAQLRETGEAYWGDERLGRTPTRHRYEFVRAIVEWADDDLTAAMELMARSRRHLESRGGDDRQWDVHRLLVLLAETELLIVVASRVPDVATVAIERLDEALKTLERIRDRWKVISRSRSPLSIALRRVYGDMALAASALPGQAAAELGLRVSLSAKQTGFATRMRMERTELAAGDGLKSQVIERVMFREERALTGFATNARDETQVRSHQELTDRYSRTLADLVLPAEANVDAVIGALAGRHALDYVSLPDTVSPNVTWFRTLVEPDGAACFEKMAVQAELAAFLRCVADPAANLADVLAGTTDWLELGEDLLPDRFRDLLNDASESAPIELVVSAHGELSLLPWVALKINTSTRLIDRALVMQTPVLTCLSGQPPPAVAGLALVELVAAGAASGQAGVSVEKERLAWRIQSRAGDVPLSDCVISAPPVAIEVPGDFAAALAAHPERWQLAHVASHGSGHGLGQTLALRSGPLSAGRALSLRWPASVLMASCDVGRLVNAADGEPLSFVMAMLSGGSHCVVAAIDSVPDGPTGEIAARVVKQCQEAGTSLPVALREAQLSKSRRTVRVWALLSAYVR
jgi:hypothetical protein